MLSTYDDDPIHQTAYPIGKPGTSDRNFYDRYYFNVHDTECGVFMAFGLAVYPNLGLMDAFACGVRGSKHFIVRASRKLDNDRHLTRVGPLSIEVVEGLKKLRIVCEESDHDLAFDLVFDAWAPAYEEPHFLYRNALGRDTMNYTRLTQIGRMKGDLRIAGESFAVEPEKWRSVRDRSWGVRPVGDPEPEGALVEHPERIDFFWNWSPVHYDDFATLYTVSEYPDGRRWHQSGVLIRPGEDFRHAVGMEHDIRFEPGTRRFAGATVTLDLGGGEKIVSEYTPKLRFLMPAIGYRGPWAQGQYKGRLVVEGETWDADDEETAIIHGWLTENLCEVRSGDRVGRGIFELAVVGPHRQYGFEDAFDGWNPG